MFEFKGEEIRGQGNNGDNEELSHLNNPPNIIKMVKSRSMRHGA
jgi:hypothetical protein